MASDFDRLLLAAQTLHPGEKIVGPSSLARFLGESPQLMTNWKARGVPSGRITELARKIGCRADYIELGEMPMTESAAIYSEPTQPLVAKEERSETYGLSIHLEALRQSARVIADAFGMQPADVLEAALKTGQERSESKPAGRPKEAVSGVRVIDPNKPIPSGRLSLLPHSGSARSTKGGMQ